MTLTPEQSAALQTALQAAWQPLTDATPDDLADAFHKAHQAAGQKLIDKGSGTAKKSLGPELREAERKWTEAQAEITKRDERIAEIEAKVPDMAVVRKQYDERERDLKEKHKGEIAARDGRVQAERFGRVLSDVSGRLLKLGIRPKTVNTVIDLGGDPAKRLRFPEEGGVEVLQPGRDIAYAPPEGQDALDLYAAELYALADPDWQLVSGADHGSGLDNSGGRGQSSIADMVRKQLAARHVLPSQRSKATQ